MIITILRENVYSSDFCYSYRALLTITAVPQQTTSNTTVTSGPTQQQSAAVANAEDNKAETQGDTYLRGQNTYIDPVTRAEKEQVRKKELEYQVNPSDMLVLSTSLSFGLFEYQAVFTAHFLYDLYENITPSTCLCAVRVHRLTLSIS